MVYDWCRFMTKADASAAKTATTLTISCAMDADLAKAMYDYLKSAAIAGSYYDVALEGDEVYVSAGEESWPLQGEQDALIVERISSFLKSSAAYRNHKVMVLGDLVTVGVPAEPGQLMEGILACEMCSYITPFEEQLRLHRMTHGNVMIG